MKNLFQVAYIAAFLLWIPLAMVAAMQPSVRRRVLVPLLASAIAAAYEAYMSLVWSHTVSAPIRVDILLVMFVLGGVDALAGFSLLAGGRGRRDRKPLMFAATLCLGVPALAIVGFIALSADTAGVDRNLDLARRFRFEAYFRDEETQRRAFGELKPAKNPWAGYYAAIGDDFRFAHLVINDEGAFWIFSPPLYVTKGVGSAGSTGEFTGVGDGRMSARLHMALRRQEGGPFLLELHDDLIPASPTLRPAPMRKADPPRFPRPASSRDEVRFVGMFSATYGERNGDFWLVQAWLWESGGEWWGQYLRDNFTRGSVREFVSPEAIDPVCSEQCKVLSFKTSRGPATLTRVSDDEFSAMLQGEHEAVALKRGETLPGFFFDLAPLATKKENRQWIEAVTTAVMITWNVPSAGQAEQGPVRREPSPWFDLESELNQRGVKTDSASLIEIARADRDVGTRWTAIEILGLRKEERAKPVLERILEQSYEPLLKETAALAIARLGYSSGINNLEALMRGSTNAERQIFMAARLAEFGDVTGYTYVARAAAGGDPHLQYLSAGALVPFLRHETGSSGIDPTSRFLYLLQNEDPKIRKEVLVHVSVAMTQGLSANKVRPIVERLAAGDRDESVREAARLLLISLPPV